MELLEEAGSCGDEDGTLEIQAFPVGPSRQAELFVVTHRERWPHISLAGLFTPEEFYQGMRDELNHQLELHPEWQEKAAKLVEKYKLDGV